MRDDKIYYLNSAMKTKKYDTNDAIIRLALRQELERLHQDDPAKVIEELGIDHGSVRADIAAVNGILHCYEIKSDRDTLVRLSNQMKAYNGVFDKVTIVVGYAHIYEALDFVPDWWGVMVAKQDSHGAILFSNIREAAQNNKRDCLSLARLLWRNEALQILESNNNAYGVRSKTKDVIYARIVETIDLDTLADKVKQTLNDREAWRTPLQPA